MVESIYFSSVYNHRMHPLPLGKEILKTKNYFWGLILIVRGILRNNTVFEYTSQIWVLFYPISITFGIYILNLLRKSSCPIASATVFFRCFQKYLHSANCGLDYPPPLPLQKHHSLFLDKSYHNQQTVQTPLFR